MNQVENSKKVTIYTPVPREVANWVRKSEFNRTLNDLVEDIHLSLVDANPDYIGFLDAVYDEQAVEGSLSADNMMAAQLIRAEAHKRNIVRLHETKLATIVKALNVVLRRYGVARSERRNTVNGEVVPTGNGD